MEKILLFFSIIFFYLFSSTLGLDLKGKTAFSGNMGAGFPLGDFANADLGAAETGGNFGFSFEYFFNDNIALGGDFNYHSFGKEMNAGLGLSLEYFNLPLDLNIKQKLFLWGAHFKYVFNSWSDLVPYARLDLGSGTYHYSGETYYKGFTYSLKGSYHNRVYIGMGAGIIYKFGTSLAIFAQGSYTHFASKGVLGTVTAGNENQEELLDKLRFNSEYFTFGVGLTLLLNLNLFD